LVATQTPLSRQLETWAAALSSGRFLFQERGMQLNSFYDSDFTESKPRPRTGPSLKRIDLFSPLTHWRNKEGTTSQSLHTTVSVNGAARNRGRL